MPKRKRSLCEFPAIKFAIENSDFDSEDKYLFIRFAILDQNLNLLNFLLNDDHIEVNINSYDSDGFTLLYHAIRGDSLEILDALLKNDTIDLHKKVKNFYFGFNYELDALSLANEMATCPSQWYYFANLRYFEHREKFVQKLKDKIFENYKKALYFSFNHRYNGQEPREQDKNIGKRLVGNKIVPAACLDVILKYIRL